MHAWSRKNRGNSYLADWSDLDIKFRGIYDLQTKKGRRKRTASNILSLILLFFVSFLSIIMHTSHNSYPLASFMALLMPHILNHKIELFSFSINFTLNSQALIR